MENGFFAILLCPGYHTNQSVVMTVNFMEITELYKHCEVYFFHIKIVFYILSTSD